MQLVRSHQVVEYAVAVEVVLELEPPLAADCVDVQGVVGGRLAAVGDDLPGRHGHHHDEHDGDERPQHLEAGVAVDLLRDAAGPLAVPEGEADGQPEDADEDRHAQPEREQVEELDVVGEV